MRFGPTLGSPRQPSGWSFSAFLLAFFLGAVPAGLVGMGAGVLFDWAFGTNIAFMPPEEDGSRTSLPGSIAALVGFVWAYIAIQRRRSARL